MDLIEIHREGIEDGSITGFVIVQNSEYLVVNVVSEDIQINGYQILRKKDITEIKNRFPSKAFILKALSLNGDVVQPMFQEACSLLDFIEQSKKEGFLVCIERGDEFPDEVFIGEIISFDEKSLTIRAIGVDAVFEESNENICYKDITSVEVGSRYVSLLGRVALSV